MRGLRLVRHRRDLRRRAARHVARCRTHLTPFTARRRRITVGDVGPIDRSSDGPLPLPRRRHQPRPRSRPRPRPRSRSRSSPHDVGDHSGYETGELRVDVLERILGENDRTADANRQRFHGAGVRVVNLMSSPGAGKTTLLRATLQRLQGQLRLGIIEGDIETSLDADLPVGLRCAGVAGEHVTTGSAASATSTRRWCGRRCRACRWTNSTSWSSRTSATWCARPSSTSVRIAGRWCTR